LEALQGQDVIAHLSIQLRQQGQQLRLDEARQIKHQSSLPQIHRTAQTIRVKQQASLQGCARLVQGRPRQDERLHQEQLGEKDIEQLDQRLKTGNEE
jgi:hypothetical protein